MGGTNLGTIARSFGCAALLLGLSVVGSEASTLPIGGPSQGIGLGSTSLATITLTDDTSVTSDFFFTLTAAGTLSANATEGTSAGDGSVNPFSITLIDLTSSTQLATDTVPSLNGTQWTVNLNNVGPLNTSDSYELAVVTQCTICTAEPVAVDGNIFIQATPLPTTWAMLFAGLFGVGFLGYRGSKKQSGGLSMQGAAA
jgi:hypothetical protein